MRLEISNGFAGGDLRKSISRESFRRDFCTGSRPVVEVSLDHLPEDFFPHCDGFRFLTCLPRSELGWRDRWESGSRERISPTNEESCGSSQKSDVFPHGIRSPEHVINRLPEPEISRSTGKNRRKPPPRRGCEAKSTLTMMLHLFEYRTWSGSLTQAIGHREAKARFDRRSR